MATQQQRITELAQAIAQDIKELKAAQGLLDNLSTANKTSLIEAINELYVAITNTTAINDNTEKLTTTWSSTKIKESITTLTEQMGKRVRVDESQVFSTAERLTACTNIGIGDPDTDLLSVYTTAKA